MSGEFFERQERLPDGRIVRHTVEARRFAMTCINRHNGCKSKGHISALAQDWKTAHRFMRRSGWRISPDGTKATCPECMEAYGREEATMSEQFYDDEIAPVLMELAQKCEARGMSFIALCEFAQFEHGHTMTVREGASATTRIVRYAMETHGNVDLLVKALREDGKEHGHNSAYLAIIEREMTIALS